MGWAKHFAYPYQAWVRYGPEFKNGQVAVTMNLLSILEISVLVPFP